MNNMQYQTNQRKIQQKPVKLNDAGELQRLHMRYAGIFKNNIKEYAEKYLVRTKVQKNYSR